MQQKLEIPFYECSWQKAQDAVNEQRPCDQWVWAWPSTDSVWLFGNYWYPPQPYSPLARNLYDTLTASLNTAYNQAYSDCESGRYVAESKDEGVRIRVASRLTGGGTRSAGVDGGAQLRARASVTFSPLGGGGSGGSGGGDGGKVGNCTGDDGQVPPPDPNDPNAPPGTGQGWPGSGGAFNPNLPSLPAELFSRPIGFGATIHGPGGGNYRWELQNPYGWEIGQDPWFEHYGRRLGFPSSVNDRALSFGLLVLFIDRVADLWVEFEKRPVPLAVRNRVNPQQPLRYTVSQGAGFFNFAAVVEVTHLESGQTVSWNLSQNGQGLGQIPNQSWWPQAWSAMSQDAQGVIRHGSFQINYWMSCARPADLGLPATGTYRMRVMLLAIGYRTYGRTVMSNASGLPALLMSNRVIELSHWPSLITYTPGMTQGLMPPWESQVWEVAPSLAAGIEFDAVFDLKNITTFRFVVKVANYHDFAIGVIVQASGWQAWVTLQPGETRHLAGAVSISGMFNWNAYPLHPDNASYYGWDGSWGSSYISMVNGQCQIPFSLFFTAPSPETTPAGLPTLRGTQRWYWDLAGWGPQYEPEWGAIKRFATDGRYDYEYNLSQYNLSVGQLKSVTRSVSKPAYQPLIDPATYFVTGYDTSMYDWVSPWHKRPWPGYSGWGSLSAPIMVSGERQIWNGSQYVWVPEIEISLTLTRPMLQQVAALLDVVEAVVMDGDDIRWFKLGANGAWHNVLWIDRFTTRAGALVDATAMRNAFQSVIANNAASWPSYRNLVVHASVRFGSFLDNGGFEVGDYFLNDDGDMRESSGLDALSSISPRFLYRIRPEFR